MPRIVMDLRHVGMLLGPKAPAKVKHFGRLQWLSQKLSTLLTRSILNRARQDLY